MAFGLGKGKRGVARGASPGPVSAASANLDLALDALTAELDEPDAMMRAVAVQLAKVNLILHIVRSRVAAGVPAAQGAGAGRELERIFDGLSEAEMLATEVRRRLDQAMSGATAPGLRLCGSTTRPSSNGGPDGQQ